MSSSDSRTLLPATTTPAVPRGLHLTRGECPDPETPIHPQGANDGSSLCHRGCHRCGKISPYLVSQALPPASRRGPCLNTTYGPIYSRWQPHVAGSPSRWEPLRLADNLEAANFDLPPDTVIGSVQEVTATLSTIDPETSPPPEATTHAEFDALPQNEKIKWLVAQFRLDASPLLQRDYRLRKEVIRALLQFADVISIGAYGETN